MSHTTIPGSRNISVGDLVITDHEDYQHVLTIIEIETSEVNSAGKVYQIRHDLERKNNLWYKQSPPRLWAERFLIKAGVSTKFLFKQYETELTTILNDKNK